MTSATGTLGPSSAPLPPLVRGLPLLGNTISFARDPVAALVRWHAVHGPIFRMRVGTQQFTVMGGVDANRFITESKDGLFSNREAFVHLFNDIGTEKNMAVLDGEEHAKYRKVAQPSYSRGAMAQFIPVVDESLRALVAGVAAGASIDVFAVMQRLISVQLGRGITNTDVEDSVDGLQRYMRFLLHAYVVRMWPRWVGRLPAFRNARATSHRVVDEVVRQHQLHAPPEGEASALIHRFLAAHADDPVTFPMDAVRAASFGPFLAGQDTVAATTAFTLAAIYVRPDVRERIQHEVDAVYADGVPDAARFRHAATLARAVKEAMRLYPVAPFLPKVAATEFEFGGYRVPKGTDVYQFHTRSHFEAEHYENPWEFDIDRPTPKAAAYAPFGVGPHTCIGAGMGELQVICNVAALMHHGAWEVVPKGYTVTRNVLPMSPRGFRLRLVGRRTEEAK